MRIAASIASPSWPNASCCCVTTPPSDASAPEGSFALVIAFDTEVEALARSLPFGVTETVAVRCPRWVVTDAGLSLCCTVAIWSSRMSPARLGIVRAFSSSTVVGGFALCR